jgi:RNA polymerase sigma factor (sigma-70 family)
MDDQEWLAERFEEHRPHLRAVAYRMLGSLTEADDAVQEAWLHVGRSGAGGVENLGGWLRTVVARVCLDKLRSRRSRPEDPFGVRLPDPILDRPDGVDPEHQALLADLVGLALLVVLDALGPAERLAFVLHDLFAVPFEEIAPLVGRSPAAARQLASRARRRVRAAAPAPDADRGRQRAVALAALGFAWLAGHARPVLVNGAAGLVAAPQGRLASVLGFTVRGGRIVEIDILADPRRLGQLDLAVLDG